ncbi:family 10 glycosylhydrolase [Portibacter marinus]|uniref:family 10 glycosylhydrolase n=1 Tax=Portibacter marinus TaxID=2898660 RepID=UPI001F340BB0|nr:family 10 glycosylhydrolase [Portibacter marinus]
MKKRDFLKSVSTILGGMSFGLHFRFIEKKLPKYWIWLRPDFKTKEDEWHTIFAKLKAAGIEAVLPQIYSSHEALFEIEGYTVKERWLEKIIPIAHDHGIQIHAWMWTMPCNDPQIIEKHPEWYVVNRKGEPAYNQPAYVPYYKFLCPRRNEVRQFVQHRVKTLAQIPELDGIHLDYVRMPDVILAKGLQPKYNIIQDQEYPEYDYCYCDYCRSEYQKLSGVDPMDLDDPQNDKDWYEFRYKAVNDMVNQYLVPAAKSGNKAITAAVFPNWQSVRQQWHQWNLDGFLPMLYQGFYNEDILWIGEEVAKAKQRLGNDKPVFAGIFLPHMKDDDLLQAYQHAVEKGANGFSIFAYGNLNPKDYELIKKMTK